MGYLSLVTCYFILKIYVLLCFESNSHDFIGNLTYVVRSRWGRYDGQLQYEQQEV